MGFSPDASVGTPTSLCERRSFLRDGANSFSVFKSVTVNAAPCSAKNLTSPTPRPSKPRPITVTFLPRKKSHQSFILSERRDSNPESHEPESCMLPLHHAPPSLKLRRTSPLHSNECRRWDLNPHKLTLTAS